MLLEHFDKCSDLKNFTDKTVTHRKLEGVSSEDIDKCSQLDEVIDEHNDYLYLYDDDNNDSNKLENLLNNLTDWEIMFTGSWPVSAILPAKIEIITLESF